MSRLLMNLKVLVPSGMFVANPSVSRIVAEARNGSFGLLPHRLDCVAALTPGILIYETPADGEVYVAIDDGVLIKTGRDVLVSVRRAIAGTQLEHLRTLVERDFLTLSTEEQTERAVMAKLETGFLHRLASLHDA